MSYNLINQNEQKEILNNIKKLVAIESIRDLSTKREKAPFGENIRLAMDCFLEIANDWGFRTKDYDGYACTAEIGPVKEDYIGVLAHIDVVGAGDYNQWDSHPFDMTIKDNMIFGRGVNDDKGPLIGSLYAAKIAFETSYLNYPIRIIVGGAEETTWECMEYYFKHEKQPIMAFSPDGNFPIVNGEKGILQLSLIFPYNNTYDINSPIQTMYNCSQLTVDKKLYKSDHLKSRNPQRGTHALFKWLDEQPIIDKEEGLKFCYRYLYQDVNGIKLGIDQNHPEMGDLNLCVMSINGINNQLKLDIDIRYPESISEQEIIELLKVMAIDYQGQIFIIKSKKPLFVSKDSTLIKLLSESYEEVMQQKAQTITKGGASYARVLDCGIAFGATFENEETNPHMPNECMSLKSLWKAIEIYRVALIKLCNYKK